MIRKRRMFAKMFGLLLSLLLLSVFTAQVLFAADVFSSDKHIKTGLNCDNCHGAAKVAAGAEVGMAKCLSCHGPYEKLAKRTEKMSRQPAYISASAKISTAMCATTDTALTKTIAAVVTKNKVSKGFLHGVCMGKPEDVFEGDGSAMGSGLGA